MKRYVVPEIQVEEINVTSSYLLSVSGEYDGRFDAKEASDQTDDKDFGW